MLLSLCVVLVIAAPAYASDGAKKHGLRAMQGTVSSIADDSITVSRGDDELTCARGKHSPAIDGIEVGDRVAILCRQSRHHRRILVRLKQLDTAPAGDEGQRLVIAGQITTLGDGSITVHSDESGRTVTCRIPDRGVVEHAKKLEVGDRVAMLCRGPNDGTAELVKLVRAEKNGGGKHDGDKPDLTDIAGHVTALGDGSITIGNGDGGRTLTCTVPDSLAVSVAALHVGDAVKMVCRNGELVGIHQGDAPQPSAPQPAPQSFSFTGPVTLLSSDRVGVRVEGETRSCFVPVDLRPQLSGFALDQTASLTCAGADRAHAKLTAIAHASA